MDLHNTNVPWLGEFGCSFKYLLEIISPIAGCHFMIFYDILTFTNPCFRSDIKDIQAMIGWWFHFGLLFNHRMMGC